MRLLKSAAMMVLFALLLAACGSNPPPPTEANVEILDGDELDPPALATVDTTLPGDEDTNPVQEDTTFQEVENSFTIASAGAEDELSSMFATESCTNNGTRVMWSNNANAAVEEGATQATVFFVLDTQTNTGDFVIAPRIPIEQAEILGGAEVTTATGATYDDVIASEVRISSVPSQPNGLFSGTFEMTLANAQEDVVTLAGQFDYEVNQLCY